MFQANFSKNDEDNKLIAPCKLLSDSLHNFQATEEEITLSVNLDKTHIRNYVENESGKLESINP